MKFCSGDLDESPCTSPGIQPRMRPRFRQRKQRKTGLTNVELQKMLPELTDISSGSDKKSPTPRYQSQFYFIILTDGLVN